MRPVLVAWLAAHHLPGWLAPTYVFLVGVAGLAGGAVTLRLARRAGVPSWIEARALAVIYAASIAGGYLFEALRRIPDVAAALAAGQGWSALALLDGGRAAYGGLIFGTLAVALYLRRARRPIRPFFDRATPALGVIYALVRTGCFLSGCDYGVPTAGPLGVRFPPGSPAAIDHAARGWVPAGAPSLPVHPTQLYEVAVAALATAVACLLVRRARDGGRFLAWIAVYAAGRFALELLRGDEERGVYVHLSTAQYVSLALLAAAAGAFLRTREGAVAAITSYPVGGAAGRHPG